MYVGAQRHTATVVDASPGGLFIQTDAPLWPTALVRVRHAGCDRFAVVVHQRHVPQRLRALLPGGVGVRWVRAGAPH